MPKPLQRAAEFQKRRQEEIERHIHFKIQHRSIRALRGAVRQYYSDHGSAAGVDEQHVQGGADHSDKQSGAHTTADSRILSGAAVLACVSHQGRAE